MTELSTRDKLAKRARELWGKTVKSSALKKFVLGSAATVATVAITPSEASAKAPLHDNNPQAKEYTVGMEKETSPEWNLDNMAEFYQQINKRFFEDYSLCGYDNRGVLEAVVSDGKKLCVVEKHKSGDIEFNGVMLTEKGVLYQNTLVNGKNMTKRVGLSSKAKENLVKQLNTMDNLCTKEEKRFKENPEEYLARRNPGNQQLLTMLMRNDAVRDGEVDGLEIKTNRKTGEEYLSYKKANPQKPRKSMEYKISFGYRGAVEIEGVSGYENIANILKEAVIKGERSGVQKGQTLDITQMLYSQKVTAR